MPSKTPASEVGLSTRFWMRTQAIDPRSNDCMNWCGTTLPTGYGQLTDEHGQTWYAHRCSWYLINGPIPAGMIIRHRCHNPTCVRPSHLVLGTHQQNADDKRAAGRTRVIDPPNEMEAAAIRYLAASDRWSQGQIARLVLGDGAAQPAVNKIVQGLTYRDAPGPVTKKGRGVRPKNRRHP